MAVDETPASPLQTRITSSMRVNGNASSTYSRLIAVRRCMIYPEFSSRGRASPMKTSWMESALSVTLIYGVQDI